MSNSVNHSSSLPATRLTRREFLLRAAAAASVLDASTIVISTQAQQDPFESIALAYRSTDEKMTMGYLSRPRADAQVPGVVILHDTMGLDDRVRDIARRIASEQYMVVAPDFLSRQGGTAHFRGNEGDIAKAIRLVMREHITADSGGAIAYFKSTKRLRENRVGTIGFGWGADGALSVAATHPDVRACVLFHKVPQIDSKSLAKLRAPVLALFGGDDSTATQAIPAFETALKKAGRQYEIKVYPGVRAGFDDATAKDRYSAEAAKDAWSKMVTHLENALKGESALR
jgi:carboxymethylenebutenolidase